MLETDVIDVQASARAVIDRSLNDLIDIGLSEEEACALLIIQGSIRLEDRKVLREVQRFVATLTLPESAG